MKQNIKLKQIGIMAVMSFLLLTVMMIGLKKNGTGKIIVDPGNSVIYFSEEDVLVNGWDSHGITYFFIPSYVCFKKLSYDESKLKIFNVNGELLEYPVINEVSEVLVENGDGTDTPCKVGFFHSSDVYTIELGLKGDIGDIELGQYSPAAMKLISPGGKVSRLNETVQIKGRGNTTWEQCLKKSYTLKLSESAALCGMEPADKWCLLANEMDSTRILNKMIFDIAGEIGLDYSPESVWVDLYSNGFYEGQYLLTRKPDIDDMPAADALYEYNIGEADGFRFVTESDMPFFITTRTEDPEKASGVIAEADAVINSDEEVMESDVIDVRSFGLKYLIECIFHNTDRALASQYFYSRNQVLYAGPCWDYDQSCGAAIPVPSDYSGKIPNRIDMKVKMDPDYEMPWNVILLRDDSYRDMVREEFIENREVFYKLVAERIDDYHDHIDSSLKMDYERWAATEEDVGTVFRHYSDIDNNYRFLKYFIYNRLTSFCEFYEIEWPYDMPELNYETSHSVTVILPDGREEVELVQDGATDPIEGISFEDINDLSIRYGFTHIKYEEALPVYEDVTIVTKQ